MNYPPMTAADLDRQCCADCGAEDCALEMSSGCHPGYPVRAAYRLGTIVFVCGIDGNYIATVAVAPGRKDEAGGTLQDTG